MPEIKETTRLKDLWNETEAQKMSTNQLALLRYRSNLLGADLRITNFGGGNTSSKIELPDPFTGRPVRVLAVKGSGGDLGSITRVGIRVCSIWTVWSNSSSSIAAKNSKMRWSPTILLRPLARIAWRRPSILLCTLFFPYLTSTTFTLTGLSR